MSALSPTTGTHVAKIDLAEMTDEEKRELNSVATEAAMDSLKNERRLAWPPGEFFGELARRRDAALEALLIKRRSANTE